MCVCNICVCVCIERKRENVCIYERKWKFCSLMDETEKVLLYNKFMFSDSL